VEGRFIMGSAFVHRLAFGLLLVGLGLVLLLNQQGMIRVDIGELLSNYWPLILIYYFGVRLIFRTRSSSAGSMIWSLIGLFFGFYFLALNMDWIDIGFGDLITYAIPVALIVIGLSMIFKPKREHAPGHGGRHGNPSGAGGKMGAGGPAGSAGPDVSARPFGAGGPGDPFGPEGPGEPAGPIGPAGPGLSGGFADSRTHREAGPSPFTPPPHDPALGFDSGASARYSPGAESGWTGHSAAFGGKKPHRPPLQRSSLFGDHHIGGEPWTLEPINVNSLVGDTVIDLTTATIPAGETRINISTLIGDVIVWLPDDPGVDVSVVSSLFFGSAQVLERSESGLLKTLEIKTPDYGAGLSQLRIHVSVLIGDLTIRRRSI